MQVPDYPIQLCDGLSSMSINCISYSLFRSSNIQPVKSSNISLFSLSITIYIFIKKSKQTQSVYIYLFVNIEIKTLGWHIQQSGVVLKLLDISLYSSVEGVAGSRKYIYFQLYAD